MRIRFNTPPLGIEHWDAIKEQAKITINNSISPEMRKTYNEIIKEVNPEISFGMFEIDFGDRVPKLIALYLFKEKELPEEISDFLWNCFWGSYEFYCKRKGIIR